jgi:YHS domain-containing protein/thiol-disulfide isomerase/thioredoxin
MSTRLLFPVVLFALKLLTEIHTPAAAAEAVSWRNNLDAAKIEATQSNKLVLLHFYTTSCGPCRMLDENVFSQAQVGDDIERNYVPVKVNADEAPALAAAFRIERVPSEVVLTPQGNVVASLSCPQNAGEYAGQLVNVADHYRQYTVGQPNANQPAVQSAYAGLQVGQYANQPVPQQQATVPASPAATNNPYTAGQNAVYTAAAAPNYGYAPANNLPSNPDLPANAMPNSYRQQAPSAQPPVQQSLATANPAYQQPLQQGSAQQVVTNPPAGGGQSINPAGSQVNPASHISVTRQLPAGSPPLAFEGYCPVALKSAHKWVAGDLKFGAIHRGRTFLFMGEEQRQQFLANPDAYCPVFSGMDPVLLLDDNQVIEGSRRFGFEYRGAFYLFANQESMNRFKSQPDQYAAGVRQAMNRMETTAGGGTVLR